MAAKKATTKTAATKKKAVKKAVKVIKKSKTASKAKAVKKEKIKLDVQAHSLVPTHQVLSEKETTVFFEEHSMEPTSLPTIYISDPAIKDMDVKMGDVIKITRDSLTARKSIFYRRVAYE